MNDRELLLKTLKLAELADGHVSPNPMVGALLTKNGQIVSQGHHQKFGHHHAEIEAINQCRIDPSQCTLYTSLEPCCHTDKQTPPCTERIIQEGIKKVVIGALDSNPKVSGKGVKKLKDHGIDVHHGLIEEEERLLNERYHHFIKTQRPFVHLKWAQTLDGFIATNSHDSKWISSEKCRVVVHDLRGRYDAVAIGSDTANADDPSLNVRYSLDEKYPHPYRTIFGSTTKLNPELKLFNDELKHKTILFTYGKISEQFKDKDIEIVQVPTTKEGKVDLHQALKHLAAKNITSLLVEGGGKLNASFMQNNLVDKVSVFIAPKIIGSGISPLEGFGLNRITDGLRLKNLKIDRVDDHMIFEGNLP